MHRRRSTRGRVGFRVEEAGDAEVVRVAHVAHRAELFSHVGLTSEALDRLCWQQHELQERHISAHNPQADRRMIVSGCETVGRLCLDRTGATWRIVDVALLPEAQGSGIGAAAVRLVLSEAASVGASVDLMVGHDNPRAEVLYRRLGFVDAIHASATHRRLLWTVAPGRPSDG